MADIINFQDAKTPKFDPNKKYTWNQDELFTLTGSEFGLLLNSLRAVVSTKEAQTIILASKAADLIEEVLIQNVEKGIIKEITE
jgi:hypothetical protein